MEVLALDIEQVFIIVKFFAKLRWSDDDDLVKDKSQLMSGEFFFLQFLKTQNFLLLDYSVTPALKHGFLYTMHDSPKQISQFLVAVL